jgi:hypothetical protein
MKLPSLIIASLSLLGFSPMRGAEATAPVDYTQRNQGFAPGGASVVLLEKMDLPRDATMQDKRVEKTTVAQQLAAVGARSATVDVQETREKNLREFNSHRPDAAGQPMSALNHRAASIATSTDTRKPPLVTKYQDSLAAASTSNMARFPALGQATAAKINRFVFRNNTPAPAVVTGDASVTPSGGGSPGPK